MGQAARQIVGQAARRKENIKSVSNVDLFKMVGSLVKDQLSRVRVPALTFTLPSLRGIVRAYWDALWGGHHLPLRLRIDGGVDKEIFVGRLGFAVTYIVVDTVYLVGKFGIWILKKIPWKINVWNIVLVAGLVIGFLGWVFPWWLEEMDFMDEIEQTKTMQVLSDIHFEMPTVPEIGLNVGWLALVPLIGMIGTAPFSVVRFRKWKGLKVVLREKSKPIIGEDENPY